jgi:broad-specificity NMP kinase
MRLRRVCAAGSPGIGKSTTAPIIIRMLLREGCTDVYHVRSHKEVGWAFEFSPQRDGSVVTEVYPERGHISAFKSLDSHKR